MDRLGAALDEAQKRREPQTCPTCGKVYTSKQPAWYRKHLLWCGVERRFESAPVEHCDYCRGPCHSAHQRYLRTRRQHAA